MLTGERNGEKWWQKEWIVDDAESQQVMQIEHLASWLRRLRGDGRRL